jgi:4-amino-4-deoxy-L-arabinose transferase-like glycosyltransferase
VISLAIVCDLLSIGFYLMFKEQLIVQVLWISSIVLFLVGFWCIPRTATLINRWHWYEYILVAITTIVGFGLRFWRLTDIPSQVDNDVAMVGVIALQAINNGDYRWIGFSDSGHLQSYTQLYAWSMRLFGTNQFGLVISSVIAGTLSLPAVYALGRKFYNPRVGLIAMLLLAGSYTHIHFSRTLFGPIVTLIATLTVYCLFRGFRLQQPIWFGIAGLISGIGILQYDSGRVIPIIAFVTVAWWLIWHRDLLRAHLGSIGCYILGVLIGFGPMLGFALTNMDLFMGRGNDVTIWSPGVWKHATATYQVTNFGDVLWIQAMRTFLTFYLYGDSSPQFSFPRPIVAPLTASLMTIGASVSLLRIRDARSFCLLMWIFLTFVLGGVLTYDPPFWPHLNIVLPAVMLLAGVGADMLVNAWADQRTQSIRTSIYALLLVGVLATMLLNWQAYYQYSEDNARPRQRMARYINSLPTGYHVYMISDEYTPTMFAFRFYNRDMPLEQLAPDQVLRMLPPADQPLLFIVHDHDDLLPLIQHEYLRSETVEHRDDQDVLQFTTVRVDPGSFPQP